LNKVVLIGRLTKDPELKFTAGTGTAVATFTLAVDRRVTKDRPREADFIPIVVWGKPAEVAANYMSKGKLVGIAGRIQTRSYEAKDGTKRYVTEVVADEFQFLDKGNGNTDRPSSNSNNDYFNQGGFNEAGFETDITPVDDGDIPF